MRAMDVTLRPGRQITLPTGICRALDLKIGDRLEVLAADGGLLVRPKTLLAVSALREIQATFAASGLPEDELQEEGRRIRQWISRSRYGRE